MRITIPARRPVRRRSRGPGWATVLLLSVSALAAPPALGAPAADAPAAADGSDDRAASTAVSAPTSFGKEATPVRDDEAVSSPDDYSAPDEDVLAYWTPERLAAATPLDTPEPSDADAQQGATSAQPTGPEEVSEPAAPRQRSLRSWRMNRITSVQLQPRGTSSRTHRWPHLRRPAIRRQTANCSSETPTASTPIRAALRRRIRRASA